MLKNLQKAKGTLVLETAAGVGNAAKVGKIVNAGRTNAFFGEELGFTAEEMGHLKQVGKLEKTIANKYEHLSLSMQESITKYKNAQNVLTPYLKKPLPEGTVRAYIHEAGIPTFPRPKGIPENYIVRITERGAGMEYVHPTNTHLAIRVMPGKPHSPHPHQQKPYVVQMKDGKAVDKYGNIVNKKAPEAHMPLEEFVYRN